MVTQHAGSSRVRPVSVNRLATSRHRVEWEIETAILRGSFSEPSTPAFARMIQAVHP